MIEFYEEDTMMKNEYAKASAEVVLFKVEKMVATACGDATNAYDDWVVKTSPFNGCTSMGTND